MNKVNRFTDSTLTSTVSSSTQLTSPPQNLFRINKILKPKPCFQIPKIASLYTIAKCIHILNHSDTVPLFVLNIAFPVFQVPDDFSLFLPHVLTDWYQTSWLEIRKPNLHYNLDLRVGHATDNDA